MAEEISAKNNQTDRIKNGKTLGEIINDLPMVKNLRKSAPKQLGKYDFSPAIIAALKNQGEISDSITINSIMSAKEEDFIEVPSSTLESKANSFDEALKVEVDVAAAVREAKKRAAEKEKSKGKEGKKEDGRATNIGD